MFEATYSFDLENVKKQNIGVGIKKLAKMESALPFVVGHVTQDAPGRTFDSAGSGRGGIAVHRWASERGRAEIGEIAGLERAIPKNKGTEFASLLHQLAADFVANPMSPTMKTLLLGINPEAKDRLPKARPKDIVSGTTAGTTETGAAREDGC